MGIERGEQQERERWEKGRVGRDEKARREGREK